MKIDLYTKLVLTVIAGSLVVLASNHVLTPAVAHSGLSDTCGWREQPCFVVITGGNRDNEGVAVDYGALVVKTVR